MHGQGSATRPARRGMQQTTLPTAIPCEPWHRMTGICFHVPHSTAAPRHRGRLRRKRRLRLHAGVIVPCSGPPLEDRLRNQSSKLDRDPALSLPGEFSGTLVPWFHWCPAGPAAFSLIQGPRCRHTHADVITGEHVGSGTGSAAAQRGRSGARTARQRRGSRRFQRRRCARAHAPPQCRNGALI